MTATPVPRRRSAVLACALLSLSAFDMALAQTPTQGPTQIQTSTDSHSQTRGDASFRVEYTFIETGNFHDENIEFDYWNTKSHIVLLSGDYALSERWSVYAALPYVQKRFIPDPENPFGGDPHNPNDPWWIDFEPPDKRFIDDGDYHGGFQDLSFGVRYLALDGPPLTVMPYIGYGFPTDSYPFYAKAAIGANLWTVPVGVDIGYIPYFSDWYFRANLAYVFSEKPLDVNVDYWLGFLTAGYWFRPGFSVNAFVSMKYVREGLVMPWDFTDDPTYRRFPEDFDTIEWWQHDRLLRHRFINAGLGFDYFLNRKYLLSGTWYNSVLVGQSNEVDLAFSLGLTRYFSGD